MKCWQVYIDGKQHWFPGVDKDQAAWNAWYYILEDMRGNQGRLRRVQVR